MEVVPEIIHIFTNLVPLGRGFSSKENGENVSMSLENSVVVSPLVHPPGSRGPDQREVL